MAIEQSFSASLIVPRTFEQWVKATSEGERPRRRSNSAMSNLPSGVIGAYSILAPFSFASSCQGTMLLWCSIMVSRMTSPCLTNFEPHPNLTRFIDSVVPLVNTISCGEGELMNLATFFLEFS